jgi:lipoyl(octanoyl) transferase
VIHPILPLKRLDVTLTGYIRALERCAITVMARLGVEAGCREGLTGTWVGDEKLGFIGISCRKWVTYHGMSVNVTNDLAAFDPIVPCGISGCAVTSLARLVGVPPSIEQLGRDLAAVLCEEVGLELSESPVAEEVSRG